MIRQLVESPPVPVRPIWLLADSPRALLRIPEAADMATERNGFLTTAESAEFVKRVIEGIFRPWRSAFAEKFASSRKRATRG